MRCLDCASFSLKSAKPELAMEGKGCCAHHIPAIAYDATTERDCRQYLNAAPEVIAKRERWAGGVTPNALGEGREPRSGEASPAPMGSGSVLREE